MTRASLESHRRAGRVLCGLAAILAVMATAPAAKAQVTPYPSNPAPVANPGLVGQCGDLKVMLVLDESGSIANAGATGHVRAAATAFVEALADTGTQIAITAFSTRARDGVVPYREVTANNLSTFTNWINNTNVGNTGYNPTGGTNWEDGLLHVKTVGDGRPDLVVFVTDGDPTYYNSGTGVGGPGNVFDQTALNRAVAASNSLKTTPPASGRQTGSHIFVVGVGAAGQQGSQSERRLASISGVNRFPEHRDFSTADYTLATNFDDLKASLTEIVAALCGATMEITKYEWPANGTEWEPAAGWTFTATLKPPPAHRWLTPAVGADPSASVTTGADGVAHFGWALKGAGNATLSVVRERSKRGFELVLAECQIHERLSSGTVRVRATRQRTTGAIAEELSVPPNSWVTCLVRNRQRVAHLQVVKRLVPDNDSGRFNLLVDGVARKLDAGNGASTERLVLGLGSHTVSETAGTNTDLAGYAVRTTCRNHGRVIARGSGPSISVRLRRETDDVVCTITNTSTTHGNLTVVKHLVPPDNRGRFNLLVTQDGATVAQRRNVGDGGSTGRLHLPFGTYDISEQAGRRTNLGDYRITITCFDEHTRRTLVAHTGPGPVPLTLNTADVLCVIENVSSPRVGHLEVVKGLVPSDDPGVFDLLIGRRAWAQAVGDRGTTGSLAFRLGRYRVSERAAHGTHLSDYSISTTCRNHGRVVAHASGPSVSVRLRRASDDIVCTITNRRHTALPPGGGGGGTIPQPPGGRPNLVISKRMPANAHVGDRVRVTITVQNVSRHTAHTVRLHETPPSGTRIVRAGNGGSIGKDGTAVWNLGTLRPGAKRTVHVTLLVTRRGLHVNTAVVAAGNADPAFDVAGVQTAHRERRPPPPPVTG